jgi:hypothetical protein
MPIGRIQGKHLELEAITTSKFASNAVTLSKLYKTTTNTPRVFNVVIIDQDNNPTGFLFGSNTNLRIRITGSNYVNGVQVFAELMAANGYMQYGYLANTIIFNDSTNLYANFSNLTVGEYNLYIINPDSSVALFLNSFGALSL